MSIQALRARWASVEGRRLSDAVALWLRGGAPDPPAGLDKHEGRLDLRGFVLPPPVADGQIEIGGLTATMLTGVWEFRGVHWRGLDLGHSQLLSLRFFDALLEDCRFDGANCCDWRLWSTSVRGCSFVRCDLRDSALGTWNDGASNAWRGVVFDRADLREAGFSGGVLEDCSFAGARLKGVRFEQAGLLNCRFAGKVEDVIFDGRAIDGWPQPKALTSVDFRAAEFHDVEFWGCEFSDVQLPDGVRAIAGFPAVAERALRLLHGDTSVQAGMFRAELELALKIPVSGASVGVFNRADYVASEGAEFADFVESVLLRAQA